jgi:hemerythrin superfamily protein
MAAARRCRAPIRFAGNAPPVTALGELPHSLAAQTRPRWRLKTNAIKLIFQELFMTTKAKPQDAIAMLKADHAEVHAWFEEYEGLGDRANVSKSKLVKQICQALTIHTQIEEEIFYPAVREAGKDKEEDMVDEAVVEHASAKDLIAQLQEMDPEDDLYDAKVKVLGELIDHHVEEEEEEMFPDARKLKLDMVALGEEMQLRRDELAATA